jgi:hypothetical protein
VIPEALGDIARALDPAILMRDLGLEPDPWQARALRSRSDRLMLLASRQSGKSTVTSCIALHQALYTPGSTTLLFAPVERQSEELFRKITRAYQALGRPVAPRKELALSLELENDSRVICLPGKEANIRSFSSVNLAIIDEAARVGDDLIMGVSPMLAISRGRLLMLTTPFGRRGIFFDTWEGDDPAWERIRAVAGECPRYDPAFLEGERRLLGPRYFAQEYESAFVDAEGQLFSTESIEAIYSGADNSLIIAGF